MVVLLYFTIRFSCSTCLVQCQTIIKLKETLSVNIAHIEFEYKWVITQTFEKSFLFSAYLTLTATSMQKSHIEVIRIRVLRKE